MRDETLPHVDTTLGEDEMRWRDSLKRRAECSSVRNDFNEQHQSREVAGKITEIVDQSTLCALWELLHRQPQLSECIGSALFHAVTLRTISQYDRTYLFNKIASLLDQSKMLAGQRSCVLGEDDVVYPPSH